MKDTKNILIVSNHFPPLNSMAAKRYGYMCKYLETYGYKPYVITMRKKKGVFINAKLDLPVPLPKEQIMYIGSMGQRYPLPKLLWTMLCEYLKQKKMWSRVVEEFSLGWYGKVKSTVDLERLKDIDIVLGTFPTMDNLLVAKYIAKKLKVPFVAEVRDLISDYVEEIPGLRRTRRMDTFIERCFLWRADGIVTVTRGFCDILKKRYPWIDMETVYNGWDEKVEKKFHSNVEKRYLYYAGTLYEHRLESLALLMDILKEKVIPQDIEIWIRSLGPSNLDKKLDEMIEQKGLCKRVKRMPAATEDIIKAEQNSAYINLVPSSIHEEDKALMTTLPGKLFELLQYEPPILAIVPSFSEMNEILSMTEKGVASTAHEEIREFILGVGDNYKGNNKVDYYSRENQARALCIFLDYILKKNNKRNNN